MPDSLADYAVTEKNTRGRRFPDKPHPYRSDFDRDRDRIIHSEAFRRLEGKTQVFTPGLNDNYRNRLTHSIEVAQIGRTIARNLNLNEALTEAICLAHDLGHPPFGHTGEKVLNELMSDFGGFEHNRQTMHIVDFLEHPYPDFAGLNLLYETRLGLAKHSSPYDTSADATFPEKNCSLEGQVAGIADRIAYNCHDLEDGLRARVVEPQQLKGIEIFTTAQLHIQAYNIDDSVIKRTRTAKAIINILVSDCIETSRRNLAGANIKTLDDVYNTDESLVILSQKCHGQLSILEKFLFENFYMHDSVNAETKVRGWLSVLFDELCTEPQNMPKFFRDLAERQSLQHCVCDYIAGMTDRYCLATAQSLSH
jgi:dGTPase